jgi:acetylornithine deacetylase
MQSVEILEKLVSFNTVSTNSNLECIDWIQDFLLTKGYQVELSKCRAETSHSNLLASIGPLDRPGLMFAGHIDTVPFAGKFLRH